MASQCVVEEMSAIPVEAFDDTLSNAPLAFHKIFYPMGFPLELQTNSRAVLAAAEESWGTYVSRISKPPLVFRIGVTSGAENTFTELPAPVHRLQRNLLTNILDANNFVVTDLTAGFSFGWITQETTRSTSYLRYHILEAGALCMISSLHAAAIHAACIAPSNHGMLLCGDSGAGKSSLAFAGARAGWTFVSDDAIYLPFDRDDRTVVGNCYQFRLRDTSVKLFPEVSGRAVTTRPSGKPSIEIPTADFSRIRTAESTVVRSIVFLNRSHRGEPEIVPLGRESALSVIGKASLAAPESQAAQEAAIRHLVGVPIFELRYTDLDWAVARLERLAEQGD